MSICKNIPKFKAKSLSLLQPKILIILKYSKLPTVSLIREAILGSGLVEIPLKKRLDDLEDKILTYSIKLNDSTYFVFKDTLAISLFPKEVIELNLNNFEAILRFDYNSSELSEDNKGLLRQAL